MSDPNRFDIILANVANGALSNDNIVRGYIHNDVWNANERLVRFAEFCCEVAHAIDDQCPPTPTPPEEIPRCFTMLFSRKGDVDVGKYLKIGEVESTPPRGYTVPFDSEITAYSITREDSDLINLGVYVNGVLTETLLTTSPQTSGSLVTPLSQNDLIQIMVEDDGNKIKEPVVLLVCKEVFA